MGAITSTINYASTITSTLGALPGSAYVCAAVVSISTAFHAGPKCFDIRKSFGQCRSIQQAHPPWSWSIVRQGKDIRKRSLGSESAWKGAGTIPGWSDTSRDCSGNQGF